MGLKTSLSEIYEPFIGKEFRNRLEQLKESNWRKRE